MKRKTSIKLNPPEPVEILTAFLFFASVLLCGGLYLFIQAIR